MVNTLVLLSSFLLQCGSFPFFFQMLSHVVSTPRSYMESPTWRETGCLNWHPHWAARLVPHYLSKPSGLGILSPRLWDRERKNKSSLSSLFQFSKWCLKNHWCLELLRYGAMCHVLIDSKKITAMLIFKVALSKACSRILRSRSWKWT